MRPARVIGAIAVVLAVAAAACSSGDESAPTTTPTTTSPETTSPATTSAPTTTTESTTTTTKVQAAKVKNPCSAQSGKKNAQTKSGERKKNSDSKSGKAKKQAQSGKKNAQGKNQGEQSQQQTSQQKTSQQGKKSQQKKSQQGKQRSGSGNTAKCPKQQKKPAPKPQVRRMPLTGHILRGDAKPPARPALVVKIDNNVRARPQAGLNAADIVFEEIVEYGTRFAAVFHSTEANPVGPIRSGRTQDIDMLGRLNRPLFAWSGGNSNVVRAISESSLVSLVHGGAGGFWRSGARSAPHNLYNSTDALWAQAPANWQRPSQMFPYLAPGTKFQGSPAAGVDLRMDSDNVRWQWDPGSSKYLRYTNGAPHGAANGQVTATNVVILATRYQPSWADARSPEGQTIGEGDAWVFSRGRMIQGRWSREGPNAPYQLTTRRNGKDVTVIGLVPGRTFVELAEVGVDGPPTPLPA